MRGVSPVAPYRNGTYARDLLTSYGWIDRLSVPRVRKGGLQTRAFEHYRRRQRLLDLVILETFLLGVSTRKTRRVFQRVFGAELSPQAVSNIVPELDDEVRAFHHRRFSNDYRFVYLDGLPLSVRKPFKTRKVLLIAVGMKADGQTEIISFQVVN